MGVITVKTFDNTIVTQHLKSSLKSEGIKSFLFDENKISLNPHYNIAI